ELPVIVCINKIDKPEARPNEVIDEVLDLFIELDADEEQLECPFIYASAKAGTASKDMNQQDDNMEALFETIVDYIPSPKGDFEGSTQVLSSTIDYDDYMGRIGIGKVERGSIRVNQEAIIVNEEKPELHKKVKITKLYEFEGLDRVDVKEAKMGSIVAIMGIEDIHIGDTVCDVEHPEALPFVKISQPTLVMNFLVNDSPFAGQEGKFITSRQLKDRLFKELQTDVSLRVEETDTTDSFRVSGRGELHLSI